MNCRFFYVSYKHDIFYLILPCHSIDQSCPCKRKTQESVDSLLNAASNLAIDDAEYVIYFKVQASKYSQLSEDGCSRVGLGFMITSRN